MNDLRSILRSTLRRPAVSLVAVVMLSITLGFTVASASISGALLRRPYPFPSLDRLLIVRDAAHRGLHQRSPIAAGDFVDLRQGARAFEAVAGWRPASLVVSGAGEPEVLQGIEVSANFFDVLGVHAMQGRTLTAGEDEPGRDAVAVISRRLWNRYFGADPGALGREIVLNGRGTILVGLIPDDQCYPPGADVWVPMVLTRSDRVERTVQRLSAVALVKRGVTFGAAQRDVERIAGELAAVHPLTNLGRGFELLPLRREQYEFTAPFFLFLQVSTLLVLCLAAANVGNLLLARAVERDREFAVRTALGASCARLRRMLVGETLAMSAVAGFISVFLAVWMVRAVRVALPEDIAKWVAGWNAIAVDQSTVLVAVLLTVVIGGGLGLAIALRAIRPDVSALKETGQTQSGITGRLRRRLIAGEVCLAVVLLVAAACTLRGFGRMSAAFETLRPDRLLAFEINLPPRAYPDATRIVEFQNRMLAGLSVSPEIEAVALIRNAPASNVSSPMTAFVIGGRAAPAAGDAPRADLQVVSAGALRTLRVDVVAGRGLEHSDTASSARVAVISRAMARRLWPSADPVGATLRLGLETDAPGVTIVGVVGDLRLNWYDAQPRSVIYVPHEQSSTRQMTVLARTRIDPKHVAARVRAIVRTLDERQPIGALQPFTDTIDQSLSPVRIIGVLLGGSGLLAAFLAATGIYAVLAHRVASRRQELGVRLALGLGRPALVRLVLREAFTMTTIGIVVAVPLTVAATTAAGTAALGIPPADVATVLVAATIAYGIAIAASIAPALRASRTDPATLLRADR